jgi:hypothetical protein
MINVSPPADRAPLPQFVWICEDYQPGSGSVIRGVYKSEKRAKAFGTQDAPRLLANLEWVAYSVGPYGVSCWLLGDPATGPRYTVTKRYIEDSP